MSEEEIDRMADNFVNTQDFTKVYSVARKAECGAFWKYGFLAGLKAQTKWHKVADGDLPNTEREVLVFMWGSYYLGYYKQYDGEDRSWHFEDFDEESEQVIAWCEIPTFTDKE